MTLQNASQQAVEPERRIVRKLKSMLLAAAGLTEALAGVRRSYAVDRNRLHRSSEAGRLFELPLRGRNKLRANRYVVPLALNLSASAAVGGLCHASERPVREAS